MTERARRQGRAAENGVRRLLVHALAGTKRVWEPVAKELEDSFEVLAPTLPGHFEGEPFPTGVPPRIDALADWLERRLDAVGWDNTHIAGNSLGGWLALELAKRGRARSVVAVAPAGGWRPGSPAVKRIQRKFSIRRALGRPLLPARRAAVRLAARPAAPVRSDLGTPRATRAGRNVRLPRVDGVPRLPRAVARRSAGARPRPGSDPLPRAPGMAREGLRPSLRALRTATERGPALRGATNTARRRARADARRSERGRSPRPRLHHAGRRPGRARRAQNVPGRARHPGC